MLPENAFPITGGIMQTEEVVLRAQSTGIDGSLTDSSTFQHPLHLLSHLHSPLPAFHMAVKQEPQDDDEHNVNSLRSSSNEALNSQQAEPSAAPTSAQVTHHGHETVHQEESEIRTANQDNVVTRVRPSRGKRKSRWKLKFHHQALPPEYLDHYEAALAQEALQNSPLCVEPPPTPSPAPTSTSSPSPDAQWLQRIAAMQQELSPRAEPSPRRSVITSSPHIYPTNPPQTPTPRPPMKYSDLPYMGEMTLDNSKPRRGRKPKKADICHLIYKNYGTILPGTPGHEERKESKEVPREPLQRSDIQNRISSLLERRLTQERRDIAREQDEPLNLCIKDLNQLKIRLLRKHGNVYESGQVKSETSSDEDVECLGSPDVDNNNTHSAVNHNVKDLVYWPHSVLIHPMTLQSQLLYYQKMAEEPREQRIVPKSIYNMLEKNPAPISAPQSPRPKRIAPPANNPPTKRKRSAIFIPPMPTENNNNPATEVSICKFKFTGGAKPSLQEKKSLSVDSGGNFRYYSGTGDKSMRGYEFFPRESLQQPAGQAGSSAGVFLSATGERIPPPSQPEPRVDEGRKKRKTRKSLQREKLEQTFKEKGFLIQTQQLESAEGATYCKFRQLRKFTRYLFRSWKDYLPGNVRDLSNGNVDVEELVDGERHSPLAPISDMSSSMLDEHQTCH